MSTTALLRPLAHHKIHGSHYERLAAVYVRQSTPQQMIRHQESTRLQYGLVERALQPDDLRQVVKRRGRLDRRDDPLGQLRRRQRGRPVAGPRYVSTCSTRRRNAARAAGSV